MNDKGENHLTLTLHLELILKGTILVYAKRHLTLTLRSSENISMQELEHGKVRKESPNITSIDRESYKNKSTLE